VVEIEEFAFSFTHPFTRTWELLTMSPESGLNLQGGRFPKGRSGNLKGKPIWGRKQEHDHFTEP
jgi:hypothetical protein